MPCPICDRPTDPDYRPFCSRRCADIDLGRWLSGTYVVSTDEAPEDSDPEGEAQSGADNIKRQH